MVEIRLAKDQEVDSLKEIWKICFGDEDAYIDFYFSQKYKENETAVLLCNNIISAMATMIHVKMVMPNGEKIEVSMLYAIATLPHHQGRGFSTQIMEFCDQYLMGKGKTLSVLVPAEKSLFDFYDKRGYKIGFYNRTITLTGNQILELKTNIKQEVSELACVEAISASDYNNRRRKLLEGRLYIDYGDPEIDYQKKVSRKFGADLYGINIGGTKGCAIIERISKDKILIKEMLMPDHQIDQGIKEIKRLIPAETYVVRLPAYLGESQGGRVEPFAMIKSYEMVEGPIFSDKQGYLGIAYD